MKKVLYGELVRENFYPPISEKKKNERIANMISPKGQWGKGLAHAEPRMWGEHSNSNSGAVPKSYSLAQVESLPEIPQSHKESMQARVVPLDDESIM